jgi:hypothetical protein
MVVLSTILNIEALKKVARGTTRHTHDGTDEDI